MFCTVVLLISIEALGQLVALIQCEKSRVNIDAAVSDIML